MESIPTIQRRIKANAEALEKARECCRRLNSEREGLERTLRRARLCDMLGSEVIPAYRGDYPAWDKAGVGVLIAVYRTRCVVEWSGERWKVPIYDVLPAGQHDRQGMTIPMTGAAG